VEWELTNRNLPQISRGVKNNKQQTQTLIGQQTHDTIPIAGEM